nr:hypothetical protein [Lachnospiraceae bacterium]
MFYIDLYEAQNLLKEATLVFSSEIDNLEEDDMSLGKGIFSLYRLNSGKHIVEANLVNQKHKEYSLLISPSEVIKAFYCFNRAGEMFSYLEALYDSDYEEVTI